MFDWDDNIVHMPSKIYLQQQIDGGVWQDVTLSTREYARLRQKCQFRAPADNWDIAFKQFRGEEDFIPHAQKAIEETIAGKIQKAPSFDRLKDALVEGRLLAIITARGHPSFLLRRAVELFCQLVLSAEEKHTMLRNLRRFLIDFEGVHLNISLTDEMVLANYFSLNRYHGISSESFYQLSQIEASPQNPQIGKKIAIKDFVRHACSEAQKYHSDFQVSFGFSDDDQHTVDYIKRFIEDELSHEFIDCKFVIYDTSQVQQHSIKKMVISTP